jgi:type IV pilus assembly protein PilN
MRIAINLASKPFVELRPLFAQLRLVMAALAVLACGLGFWLHSVSASEQQDAVQMDALKAQTLAVQQRTAANEARMHLPQNQGVLARSEFLNGLFARKAFSWTAVMMDLEHVLPEGVQVTSIDPVIAKDGAVSIRLRVTGDRDKTIQLVRNLERSKHFVDARLAGESALNADRAKAIGANLQNVSAGAADLNGGAVEFEIFSGYQPLEPESSEAAVEGHRPASPEGGKSRTGVAR